MKWKTTFIVDSLKREESPEVKFTNESQAIFFCFYFNKLLDVFISASQMYNKRFKHCPC